MSIRNRLNAALLGLGAIGALAAVSSVMLGLGLGSLPVANAAPRLAPAGTIGVGERTAPPVIGLMAAEEKLDVPAGTVTVAALAKPAKLKAAPVAKKRSTSPGTRSSASRRFSAKSSRGTSSGWNSARVSWYGPGFYGNTMAGGGALRRDSMVVAHRSMAFGTRIQFEYNGRSCTAVVMDRGPYVGGRTFDLGPGTARALGFSGVGTVRYRVLGR
ncbi:MAG: septal ring lytic transglycosylase RlpA family protein [Actinomycetota bacterium]|nr:septal ring lytic transglycosylase RlpA family protein [Actinomycetota bacterium]